MITREPSLHELVLSLDNLRQHMLAHPGEVCTLRLERGLLDQIRQAFARTLLRGEEKLHRLGAVLADLLLDGEYALESVVIGELPGGQRFTLSQCLDREELLSTTDLDLGTRQLQRLQMREGQGWVTPGLVANFVEYQPLVVGPWGLHKIVSRIKAEEELWNKVTDELFRIDELVQRDKELRHLSRYVKDVLGLKIVASDEEHVHRLQGWLTELRLDEDRLARHGVPSMPSTRRPTQLELKDYMAQSKTSGWAALKSVIWWWDAPVEIQLQPLGLYLRERERLTRESHASFKSRREALRDQLAAQIPLFGTYRDLLRWIFLAPETPPPRYPDLDVIIV